MAKPKTPPESGTAPTSYPSTSPAAVGTDLSTWLLTASTKMEGTLGKVEATLTSLQTQLNRIEGKLDQVEGDVAGHGKWMHTLKAFAAVILVIIGWIFANALWPWLRSKVGIPGTP